MAEDAPHQGRHPHRQIAQPALSARPLYRRRNVIERMSGRLKNRRRIATRYDRLASNRLSALALVAVVSERI
jgi:transposase